MDLLFPSSEDEVLGVEHLLAEPKCNDIVDGVLGFGTFSNEKLFGIQEFSAPEYQCIEVGSGTLHPTQGEKTKDEFFDGALDGTDSTDVGLSVGSHNPLDICEDYLLDTKSDEDFSNLDYVPSKELSVVNLDLEQLPASSGATNSGSVKSALSTASSLVHGAHCIQNSTLLDQMTINELHKDFKNMFGRETSVQDKQWLKERISFGLENLDQVENCSIFSEYHVTSNKNKGKIVMSTSDEHPVEASSAFCGVFNFRTKPRVRHERREKHDNCDSLNALSSDISKAVFGFRDLGEKESMLARKRLRKRTQRYIEESLEKDSRRKRGKYASSHKCSKDRIQHVGFGRRCYQKRYKVSRGKEPFNGACIQVPFGLPVQEACSKKKAHQTENLQGSELLVQDADSDVEPCSVEKQDDTSEEDCMAMTEIKKCKSRRKHHLLWSLPEVLKLVEGVSKYGVGRWTEIKRLLFQSSAHRTSVDLKDKWRNLLKASSRRSQSKRGVDPKRKQAPASIPQHILRRVRELALIYPYPRGHRTRVSQTMTIGSPIVGPSRDNLMPIPTAVRG